ncbi:MAG: oxidoreductase, partial [Bacteroidales bacterium]|nr:oxidoreductase [Bacteroidales bacterium]
QDASTFEADLREIVDSDLGYDDLGVTFMKEGIWRIDIPDRHREGHEAHFKSVMEQYLEYLKEGEIPDWEISYMRVKYYLTTQALKMARETN